MKESPYWLDTLGPAELASLNADIHALPSRIDVAIIGGGYTGLSAARRLAMTGASILVLERHQIGFGASSRNGGQVLSGLKLDASALVAAYGEARARGQFDASRAAMASLESVIAAEQISCEFERTGHLQAAWKPAHFAAFRREQSLLARVFDHRVELVSAAEQRSEIGSSKYCGLLIDESSYGINPARYLCGLAVAARRRGACLAPGVPVLRLQRTGGRWRLTTRLGDLEAADVLVATNGYTEPVTPSVQCRLLPIGSYIIATAPMSPDEARETLPKRRMAFDSRHFLFYFRLASDNRLIFGGRAEFSVSSPESTRRAAGILSRGLGLVFPQLANKSIEYVWSGNVAFTRDQLPHAGKLDGMYFAGGYCGHGIAMTTHLGDLIARRIAGEPIGDPFMNDDAPPIPLFGGRRWLLPLVGGYFRVLDWLR